MSQVRFYRILALLALLSTAGFAAVYYFTGRYLLAVIACFVGFGRFLFGSIAQANDSEV